MNKCLYCEEEIIPKTNNATGRYEAKRKKFCNHSCAASYSNTKRQRKEWTKWKCIDCNCKVASGSTRCHLCKRKNTLKEFETKTLKEVKSNGNARIAWGNLRTRANTKLKLENIEKKCKICGIIEPIDCCHIKPISTFSEDTLVSEVNSLDNLVYLCKNHHWLFDKGKIKLPSSSG